MHFWTDRGWGDYIPTEEQPAQKKRKIDETKNSKSFSFSSLPPDNLREIALFLPTEEDILTFELLFKEAIQFTNLAWEKLAKQERLDFDWTLPNKESYREKASYLHGRVLFVYIASRQKVPLNIPNQGIKFPSSEVKKLFGHFEGIMKRYPSSIGAYLWQDLNDLNKPFSLSSSNDSLFQKDFSSESTVPLAAGDLLLKGLSYLSIYPPNIESMIQQEKLRRSAFDSLNQAILKGASCASYLAIQTLIDKYQEPQWYYNLAVVSLTAKEDYRSLDLFLERFPNQHNILYNQGICYPPILAKIANSKPPTEAESLLDKAIKDYNNHVPTKVWFTAAKIQRNLKAYKKAEEYHAKAIL